jgi:AraC-like DNA-binding protein
MILGSTPVDVVDVRAELEKRNALASDIGDLDVVRCMMDQFRREEDSEQHILQKDPSQREYWVIRNNIMRDLGVKEACLVRNELLLIKLPLSIRVFYFRSVDGTICRIGPFLTKAYNPQAVEYCLREAGVSSTESIHTIIQTYPVQNLEQIQQMSWLLSKALGHSTITVDATNYRKYGRKPISTYESAEHDEKYQIMEKTAEEADHLISGIVLGFRSGDKKKLDAEEAGFTALILEHRDDEDLLTLLGNYLQEEIAQITTGQFEKTHSRQLVQLLSTFMDRLRWYNNADDLIRIQHAFLEQIWAITKAPDAKTASCDRRVQEVMDYIRVHYAEKLTLQQLADKAGLSTSYLSGHFSKEAGMTISSYVRKTRINHAKLLLQYMTIPVTEIAYQCGYQDISYFIKEFRKETGCSPVEYRKNVLSDGDAAEAQAL